MASYSDTLKQTLKQVCKIFKRSAKRVTATTKFKVHEMSDLSKKRDLVRELGTIIYKYHCEGFDLPDDAKKIAKEIELLDSDLLALHTEHAAQKAAEFQQRAEEKAARAAERAAARTAAAIAQSTEPVHAEIPETEQIQMVSKKQPEVPVIDMVAEDTNDENDEVPTLNL